MMDRISICESLAKRNEIHPFLKRMVAGDKKWVAYDNIVQKLSWSKRREAAQTVAEKGLTARKVLLCIWWDLKQIIYYQLLPYGQTLISYLYCQQLDHLKLTIDQKQAIIVQQKRYCVPSGQLQTTHGYSDSPETLGAWLGSFNASTIQSGPGTKRLPPFSGIAKLPE
ncbi:mariner transposase [Trichonephila clavipes]|nr:mariner transposase [Trichonephila clavipes]